MDRREFNRCKNLVEFNFIKNIDILNYGHYNRFLSWCVTTTNWFVYKNLELVTEYFIDGNCNSITIKIRLGVHIYTISLNCRTDFKLFIKKLIPNIYNIELHITDRERNRIQSSIYNLRNEYFKEINSLITKTGFGIEVMV